MILKFKIYFLSMFIPLISVLANAQNLSIADSLFDAGKFTEALEIYQNIQNSQHATPAMLLKMAYINEGLNQYAEALYLLEKYYSITANRKVISKINEIAATNELSGFEYTDLFFLYHLINTYYFELIIGFSFLLFFATFYVVLKRKKYISIPMIGFQLLMISFLVIVVNTPLKKSEAIIIADQSILMSGPSAGSEPLYLIEKGHKVKILEDHLIWVKIDWKNKPAYIRSNRLAKI